MDFQQIHTIQRKRQEINLFLLVKKGANRIGKMQGA